MLISASRGMDNLTVPLSMMISGFILSKFKIRMYLRDWTIYYKALIKLITILMIVYIVALFMGTSSIAIKTAIIMSTLQHLS